MIEELQISPSSRAICKNCGKKMGIGIPRGVQSNYHNNHTEYSYYCYKCSKIILDMQINEIKEQKRREIERTNELKKELTKMIKDNQKAIILAELEDKK